MPRLVAELHAQFAESAKLEQAIKANLKGLGYGGDAMTAASDEIEAAIEEGAVGSIPEHRDVKSVAELVAKACSPIQTGPRKLMQCTGLCRTQDIRDAGDIQRTSRCARLQSH